MRLIFIRHAEPDYDIDNLTPKGEREAALLADRVCKWNVTDFYCSPLGRAKATAAYSLDRLKRTATVYEWLTEFEHYIIDPVTGRHGIPWDLMPDYFTNEPLFYDKDNWFRAPLYRTNPDIETGYRDVCNGMDRLLSMYGYFRDGDCYHVQHNNSNQGKASIIHGSNANAPVNTSANAPVQEDGRTIVLFCHLGVTCVMLSHLIGVSPVMLWQGTFLAPSSVTIVNSEERMNNTAYFRIQQLGSTSHLYAAGEPVSMAGSFVKPFQG